MPTTTAISPAEFVARCKANKLRISHQLEGGVLTVVRFFEAGNASAYAAAETDASLIYDAPGRGGSTWGTSGDGIGGYAALRSGVHRMNKSGVQKRWLAQVASLAATEGIVNTLHA